MSNSSKPGPLETHKGPISPMPPIAKVAYIAKAMFTRSTRSTTSVPGLKATYGSTRLGDPARSPLVRHHSLLFLIQQSEACTSCAVGD
ncbi:hypothetical protein G7Z17_g10644 [Cylindrodendrum hubeiense]|uniref:Uncharacterized protein n=1 Tax=Cylindrodendrum hubeiense TaxID=595255 RepID=A0A9P5H147_9HYPO|nr:hypothetical protein G7Z17_g10644 [Cylindrodendrum hubeiense]